LHILAVLAVIAALAVLSRAGKLTFLTGAITVVAALAIGGAIHFFACSGGTKKEKAE
jgi:hypothetical protein